MNLLIEKDYENLSKMAATIIAEQVRKKPNLVLGLATGSTPLGVYKELIRFHKEEGLDFSKVITFNLDEYNNISPENNQSYHYYMYENLFDHININKENINIPEGNKENIEEACIEYDKKIGIAGGIDLQLLGIGQNGHIGFNEPDDELVLNTHLTALKEDTIKVNSRFFSSIEEVPTQAITMGLGTIMQAKKIVLLANSSSKAEIMADFLNYPAVSTQVPASFLLMHNDLTVIMDEDAAKIYNQAKRG